VLSPGLNTGGYEVVTLQNEAGKTTKTVHRLACKAFHGQPPCEALHAAHNNGNRRDNRKTNLRWATAVENVADKRVHGTMRCGVGERQGLAKLTEEEVKAIRADARMLKDIAKDYGVGVGTVHAVKSRRTWKHI
jgi:hypothetical protein